MTAYGEDEFDAIPRGRYSLIMADPPWEFVTFSEKGLGKSPQRHYRCMPIHEIKAMPVADLAAPDCVCIMWATWPLLPQAIDTLDAWGFKYKSGGAWGKQSKRGRSWAFGGGYIYRSASEIWITGTRGKPKSQRKNVRNLIVAPIRAHSQKPDQMRQDCETHWPGERLELFARQAVEGWDGWGNEIGKYEFTRTPLGESAEDRNGLLDLEVRGPSTSHHRDI